MLHLVEHSPFLTKEYGCNYKIVSVFHLESMIPYVMIGKVIMRLNATWALGVCWTAFFEPLVPTA